MSNQNDLIQPVIEAIQQENYSLAQQLSSNIVRRYPFNEKAWVLLGDSLMFQGEGLMAQKIYARGSLFNPEAAWFREKIERLKTVPKGGERKEIEDLLKLSREASVGAAIITKDEERCIGKCIEALVDAVDEILVIDTGSTDRTIEIASSFPKTKVVHFTWNNDFSAARNFGLEKLKTRWVFWVDSDEYLFREDIEKVKYTAALLDNYQPHPLLFVGQVNQIGDRFSVHYSPRLFPLRGHLKYHGKIHEQLGSIHGNRYTSSNTHDFFVQIRLLHDGYDPQKIDIEKKLKRNIRLLKEMTEDESEDPTWWLYLGRELLSIGDIEQGINALIQAEEKGKSTEGFGALLEIQKLLVISFSNKGDLIEAEKVCHRMIQTNIKFPDSYYLLAYILVQKGSQFYEEVEVNLRKAKYFFSEYRGLVSADQQILDWKADMLLADLYRLSGTFLEAKSLYEKVLETCPLTYKDLIKKILSTL